MSEYKVTWVINLVADSAEEAARQSCVYLNEAGSQAHVFEVEDDRGHHWLIDLDLNTVTPVPPDRHLMAVVLEGGMVQSVVSHQPEALPNQVFVIDYDEDDWEQDDLSPVIQSDGSAFNAHVYSLNPEKPSIDLAALTEQFD